MSIVEMAAPVPGTYADIAHAVWTVTRAATTTIGLSRWQYMAQACLQVKWPGTRCVRSAKLTVGGCAALELVRCRRGNAER